MEKNSNSQLILFATRSIGVSNFGVPHLEALLKVVNVKPVCNQIELHPMLQWRELVEYCEKNDIKLVAYSPLIKAKVNVYFI